MITSIIYLVLLLLLLGNIMEVIRKFIKRKFVHTVVQEMPGVRNAGRVLGTRSFIFVLAVDFSKDF